MSLDKLGTVKAEIHLLLDSLTKKACKIAKETADFEDATNKIMRLVSRELNERTTGYLGDIYTTLKEYTLAEEFFIDDASHANAFHDLELGSKILDSYMFGASDFNSYSKVKGITEVKNIYLGIGASVGTMAVGGILLKALHQATTIPFIILIAGAIVVGLAAYFQGGSLINKHKFSHAVKSYMKDLEKELIKWIDGIEEYYQSQVNGLKKSIEEKSNG